jgi:DNA-binding CsgD family transcriptional regulator
VWREAGLPPIRIAVNFTAQQFLQKNLVDNITKILVDTNLPAELLEIEITESVIMGNEESIIKTLNQIRKLGVWISIDDFGTGYSSLNYLRRFPVNTLKIDKSFIQDIHSSSSKALVSTIISLAHSIHMSVVAEGVESEEQLELLRKYKCNEFQGYLFCPPVSAEEFETFLLRSLPEPSTAIADGKKIAYLNKKQVVQSFEMLSANESAFDQNQDILNAALNRTKETYSISSREMEVFHLIVNGFNNKEISDKLFISEHTVKNHITRILQKLNVHDRIQAMAMIYQTCIEEGKNLRAQ